MRLNGEKGNEGQMDSVFKEYGKIYQDILSSIYPAKNSTGFAERNLSVNFSKAYERNAVLQGHEAVSWFEFQFGKKNNLHVDVVILNKTTGEMCVVESKRFSNPSSKLKEIGKDLQRIQNFVAELKTENSDGTIRINMADIKRCYGVILADVWNETAVKESILESYRVGMKNPDSKESFMYKFREEIGETRENTDVHYNVISFCELKKVAKYNLVSMWWEI